MTCIVVKSGDHTPSVSILGVHFNNDVLVWSRRSNRLRRIELQLAHRINYVGQSGVVGKAQQKLESVGPNLSGSGRITGNMLRHVRETNGAARRSVGWKRRTNLQNLAPQTLREPNAAVGCRKDEFQTSINKYILALSRCDTGCARLRT